MFLSAPHHRRSFFPAPALRTLSTTCQAGPSSRQRIPASPKKDDEPHVPVLLEEIRSLFRDVKMRVYVDGTLGAAGHASAIARDHPELEVLVGIDQDPSALALATTRLEQLQQERAASGSTASSSFSAASARPLQVRLHRSNFRELGAVLRSLGLYGEVDGLLLDLGMSSMQIDANDRGFSFRGDAPLDMRMDPGASLSAEAIVNTWGESEIGRIIREYGEDNQWRLLARKIVDYRDQRPITTTFQLLEAMQLTPHVPRGWKGPHPATRTFQALRIAVNDELGVLRDVLPEALNALAPGGRLGVISFHSLEDRIVKRAFARACGRIVDDEEEGDAAGSSSSPASSRARYVSTAMLPKDAPPATHRLVVRKVVTASEAELAVNSRARSAKYRIVERLGAEGEDPRGMQRKREGGAASGSEEEGAASTPPFKSKYAMKKAAADSTAAALGGQQQRGAGTTLGRPGPKSDSKKGAAGSGPRKGPSRTQNPVQTRPSL